VSSIASKFMRQRETIWQRDIFRIVAELFLPDDQGFEQVANQAKLEVLRWVKARSVGDLPEKAWNFETYDHYSGGRNSHAVRVVIDGIDVWALRAEEPDRSVPGRIWSTEVIVWYGDSISPVVSVKSIVNSHEKFLDIEPHVPGLILQLSDNIGLLSGEYAASLNPIVIGSEIQAKSLSDDLISSDRILPVIIVSAFRGGDSEDKYFIDFNDLSKSLLGSAHVIVLPFDYAWILTDSVGKSLSVFNGGVRIYWPGFSEDANPYDHDLFLAHLLEGENQVRETVKKIKKSIASYSIRNKMIENDSYSFSGVRESYFNKLKYTKNENPENWGVREGIDEIGILSKARLAAEYEKNYYFEEAVKLEDDIKMLSGQLFSANARIKQLIAQLSERGENPDEKISPPELWEELENWCQTYFEGRIILTSSARNGIKKAEFRDVETASKALRWLANECRDARMSGGKELRDFRIDGSLINSICGGDEYEFEWNNRKFCADWHVKSGGNTHDPRRMLRIYYSWDEVSKQIIVSDMPAHKKTSAS